MEDFSKYSAELNGKIDRAFGEHKIDAETKADMLEYLKMLGQDFEKGTLQNENQIPDRFKEIFGKEAAASIFKGKDKAA